MHKVWKIHQKEEMKRRILIVIGVIVAVSAIILTIAANIDSDKCLSKNDKEYIQQLQMSDSTWTHDSNQDLIDLGKSVCATLDKGLTTDDVLSTVMGVGTSPQAAGRLVATAMVYYCPGYIDDSVKPAE